MKRIAGRVAVVTGAGSGIGRATSLRLAAAGCDIAVVDINARTVEETAELVRQTGRRASAHVVDVADPQRMAALPDDVLAAHGRVEILINNAGVTIASELEDHSLEISRGLSASTSGESSTAASSSCRISRSRMKLTSSTSRASRD